MPEPVNQAIFQFQKYQIPSVRRGVHTYAEKANKTFEEIRVKVQKFIGAEHKEEILFTSGTTGSINLVAQLLATNIIQPGDEIILMEHHANLIPWQLLCQNLKGKLQFIPLTPEGELDLTHLPSMLNKRTKLIAVTHASNVLGTINPITDIVKIAHEKNIPVLVDGAQGVSSLSVDVQKLDCDFYAFSAHKMLGPAGIGVLYGKKKWFNILQPYTGGGGTVKTASLETSEFAPYPNKFEAGTPNVSGVIGLGAAIEFINLIGREQIYQRQKELLNYAQSQLIQIPGIHIPAANTNKTSIISFTLDQIHPHDMASLLNDHGIATRAGHHCAEPLLKSLGISALLRTSFAFYNTKEEIDILVKTLDIIKKMFQ